MGRVTSFLLLISVLLLVCDPSASGRLLGEIRDGAVYIRGSDLEVEVSYSPTYLTDWNKNFVYFQSPTGELLERTELDFGDAQGSFTYTLGPEYGDYVITFAPFTHRKFIVEVPDGTPVVFRPTKFHTSMHVWSALNRFYFFVPEGTPGFSIHARRPVASYADSLVLYDPHGTRVTGLELPFPGAHAFYPFASDSIAAPESGFWWVEFPDPGSGNKVAFWVDGIPSDFVIDPADWFSPEHEAGASQVTAAGVAGPAGILGGLVGGNPPDELIERIAYLGLESSNYYIGQRWREPANDNADPFDIDWSGFNWDDDARMELYAGDPCHLELSSIFQPAEWLPGHLVDPQDQEELAELLEAYLIHHNAQQGRGQVFFTPLDEPNMRGYTSSDYARLAQVLGARKNGHPDSLVSQAKVLVPGSSNFSEVWAGGEFGIEWARQCYELYDADIDGINFHLWNWRSLLDHHRFGREIELAHEIIATYDSDSDTLEAIVIDQTNICSGADSSPYQVNTFYGALWWAGVVCHTIGTGYATAVHFFTTMDDDHHRKGLIYGPEENYAIKPVGYAMKMLIDAKRSEVIRARSDHPEIDVLVTVDRQRRPLASGGGRDDDPADPTEPSAAIVLVNKGLRTNQVHLQLELPAPMPSAYMAEVWRFADGMTEPEPAGSFDLTGPVLDFSHTCEPRSIYTYDLTSLTQGVDSGCGALEEPATDAETGSGMGAETSAEDEGSGLLAEELSIRPNPLTGGATFRFAPARPSEVDLAIYDLQGRLVARLLQAEEVAGVQTVLWDGKRSGSGMLAASGVYLCRLQLNARFVLDERLLVLH